MHQELTERELLKISGAYWAGCTLQAAVRLELFTALHDGPLAEAELAEKLGCDLRAFSMLVTALVSMGLARRRDGALSAADGVLRLLSSRSPDYLGFIIKHHANIMPAWFKLDEAVRSGESTAERSASHTPDERERENFLMGMFNIARLQAERVAAALDLSGRASLIDIGGGPGTYAIYFCLRNPHLKASIFDLPTTEPFALKTVARFGLEQRVDFKAGSFQEPPLPSGYDAAWLSQVLHGETREGAAALVRAAAGTLNPGGLLCVQEFVLDDDRSGPEHAALFGLNMLVQTCGGQTYTGGEIGDMMRAAGAVNVRTLEIDLPQSCRVLVGEMP